MSEINTNETNTNWTCKYCNTVNNGNFCTTCGASRTSYRQLNTTQSEPVKNTFTTQQKTEKPAKKAKSGPNAFLVALLALVVGAGSGFGGGYFAYKQFGTTNTVIYQQAEPSTQQSTTASGGSASKSQNGLTIQEIAAKAAPSVVEIKTEITTTTYGFFGGTYTSEAAGSGVIISEDGYIITNNHVVEDSNHITVTTVDGTEYDAELVGTDSKSDIAVIKIKADNLTAAVIGDSDNIQVGDTTVVIGNPLGTLGGTVTDGIISALDREIVINNESMNLIQTNAAINNGNSGGGMFDANGNLIGIVNAKDSGITSSGATIDGLGFAIPINTAMNVAQQLISNGYVTDRPTIGVYLSTLTNDQNGYKAGLYISQVIEGSAAESAGLQAYDRIVKADGTDVASYTELTKIMQNKKVGDVLTLTIERDGKEMDVDVTLTGTIVSKS